MKTATKAVEAPVAITEVGKPTKGIKPNCNGVPGALIEIEDLPLDLVFGTRKQHISPYDALLKQLLEAGEGKALLFGHERARASVSVRPKKLGIKVEMADHAGKLYVRLAPGSTPEGKLAAAAKTQPPLSVKDVVVSDKKTRSRSLVLTALRKGWHTPEAIAAHLRSDDPDCSLDGPTVRSLLKAMQQDGGVRQASTSPEKWEIAI